jgi:hypothetical protein
MEKPQFNFDHNILCFGPTGGRKIYAARANLEFLDVLEHTKDAMSLRDYNVKTDPMNILARIKTPGVLIPKEIDEQRNVVYGENVPINHSERLFPRFFDGDFFNDFYQVFDQQPNKEAYQDPLTLKQSPELIRRGKEGLREVILRRQRILGEDETLRGTRYPVSTTNLRFDGFYDGPIQQYSIPLEERKRQIRALITLGDKYLQEMGDRGL